MKDRNQSPRFLDRRRKLNPKCQISGDPLDGNKSGRYHRKKGRRRDGRWFLLARIFTDPGENLSLELLSQGLQESPSGGAWAIIIGGCEAGEWRGTSARGGRDVASRSGSFQIFSGP